MPPAATQRAEAVGLSAGTLSLTELGLGSLLHGFHVPLAGTILSLNQGLFLARLTRINCDKPNVKFLAFEISTVTALLKSFSPMGKRLTPMLAIATQGFLFTIGPIIFGVNILGVIAGSIFLATWGTIQPAILAGIMFHSLSGNERDNITTAWFKMTANIDFLSRFDIYHVIAALLFTKCLIGASLALIAWYSAVDNPHSFWSRWERFVCRTIPVNSNKKTPPIHIKNDSLMRSIGLSLKDIKSPMVVLSVVILMGLSYFTESQLAPTIWVGLRALTGIFIFYLVMRMMPWDRLFNANNKHSVSIRAAISIVNGMPEEHKQVKDEP